MKLRASFLIVSFLFAVVCTMLAQTTASNSTSESTQVPRLIRFSGVAKDDSGNAITGVLGITFSLYKDEQGGAPLWTETQNVQADATGRYTALLGSATADGIPLALFSSAEVHWISTQVSGRPESAPVMLLSVPYALKSADAETLDGLPASAFVQTSSVAVALGSTAVNATTNSSHSAGNASPLTITGSGTTDFIPLWTSSSGLGNSILFQKGGQVGVATKTPGAKLDTVGAAIAVRGTSSGATGTGVFGIVTNTTGVNFGVQGRTASTASGTAGVNGSATSTTGQTYGVNGSNVSTTTNAAAVNGFESAITGEVFGVQGATASTTNFAAGVSGNASATTGQVYGVVGVSNSTTNGAAAVNGYEPATTGAVSGVYGSTPSTTNGATGVSGYEAAATGQVSGVNGGTSSTSGTGVVGSASATSGNTTGVFGLSASPNGNGVLGMNSATSGNAFGIQGVTASAAGVGVSASNSSTGGVVQIGAATYLINAYVGTTGKFNLDYSGDGYFAGNLNVTGKLTKGSGSFKIDHPLDPANKYLSHSFVESPDMMNVYNGNITTDRHGFATVTLPDYFEALNRDFRYQLTVIGRFAQAIVAKKIASNQFVIRTNKPAVEVSWQVTGIRQDAYANANRIQVEEDKPASEQGYYLHPEVFGQPESRGIATARKPKSSETIVAEALRK